jgi:hypothetical protein
MNQLRPDTLDEFQNRFCTCDDAVIRSVLFRYAPFARQLEIVLSSQDAIDAAGRSNVLIKFQDVVEYLHRENNSTCAVLSDGLTIRWIDGLLYASFSSSLCEPETAEEFRMSDLYVVCHSCTWESLVYST